MQTLPKLEKEHIDFLNVLQKSGVTNMFGAGSYVQDEFGFDKREARSIVTQWMSQF